MEDTKIKIYTMKTGPIDNNVYIVKNTETNEGFIIDPSFYSDCIIDFINDTKCKLSAILLTHGHYDHFWSAGEIRDRFKIKIIASENEKEMLNNPMMNASKKMIPGGMSLEADTYINESEFNIAGINIKSISTPGHTAGGTCFYIQDEKILFSGDTLFKDSYGRYDLPTGDFETLKKSIYNKLFVLPSDVVVYPGHGDITNIGYEKEYNPIAGT